MKFLKENSYEISKLFVNQIGISIFALSLSFAVNALQLSDVSCVKMLFFISLFSLAFFGVLLYLAAWEMGSKDKIKVDSGRPLLYVTAEKNGEKFVTYKKGFFLGLFATAPQLIFSVICFILIFLYLLTDIYGFFSWSSVVNIVLRLGSSQYAGFLQGVFFTLRSDEPLYFFASSIGYVVLSAFPIGITFFGYVLGLKNKKIVSFFQKNPKP